jgi:hypothetical protein
MAVDLNRANDYFTNEVLHAEEWLEADTETRQKALKNAENQLYRLYKQYNPDTKPLPETAVFEQALWLLRIDDSIRKAEMGVTSVSVGGISINVSRVNLSVAPEVVNIIGRRIGRSVIS